MLLRDRSRNGYLRGTRTHLRSGAVRRRRPTIRPSLRSAAGAPRARHRGHIVKDRTAPGATPGARLAKRCDMRLHQADGEAGALLGGAKLRVELATVETRPGLRADGSPDGGAGRSPSLTCRDTRGRRLLPRGSVRRLTATAPRDLDRAPRAHEAVNQRRLYASSHRPLPPLPGCASEL